MQLEIIGSKIYTEQDFHNQISKIFSIHDYYGNNLDALWDLLSTNVERPITLVWKDAMFSKNQLENIFIAAFVGIKAFTLKYIFRNTRKS